MEAIQIITVGHALSQRGFQQRGIPPVIRISPSYRAQRVIAFGQIMRWLWAGLGRLSEQMLQSLAIQARLAGSNPDEIVWQERLCFAHKTMGEFLASQGRLAQAEEHDLRALATRRCSPEAQTPPMPTRKTDS